MADSQPSGRRPLGGTLGTGTALRSLRDSYVTRIGGAGGELYARIGVDVGADADPA